MPKYNVRVLKPVLDVLESYVEVEAETPEAAKQLAMDRALDTDDWEYSHSNDCLEPVTAEIQE